MLNFEINQFSGPLDLLLQLIEQKELDISQVSLAEVTDQYLVYLDSQVDLPLESLADFLVVATKLLIIKSKTLLPKIEADEEDLGDQLEEQLRMYKQYLEAAQKLEVILENNRYSFTREKVPVLFYPKFAPPEKLTALILAETYRFILEKVNYVISLPEKIMEKVVSLKETIMGLRENLIRCGKLNFKDMVATAGSKSDQVVCFIALLELIKSGEVAVSQNSIFEDIEIEKI
jgi:segregation and condensation protein A